MNLKIREPIPRDKWLMSLGAGSDAEQSLMASLDRVERRIFAAAAPRAVYRLMDIDMIKVRGISLARHLEGCQQVVVMALTLGAGVDSLIRRLQISDMAEAVIADSGASVLADILCDSFQQYISENITGYTTSGFSPGYGDSPLQMQSEILSYVDGQRRIGLSVTSDSLMIPRKSVTAVIGVSEHPVTGRLATCDECVLKEKCVLRKEGKFCGD